MNIITFSLHPWTLQAWKNRHHVVSRLTAWYRILYVEEPLYIRNLFKGLRQNGLPKTGVEKISENLARYRPPNYLPLTYGYQHVERLIRRLRIVHLQSVCRQLGVRRPMLVVWDPEFSYMLGHFNESLTCYFVDDQYSLFSGTDTTSAVVEEKALIERVDLVFGTSEGLCEDKKQFHHNVHLIPNGVDYERFSAAASGQHSMPSDVKGIRRPILGFIGNLDDKVDYGLLTLLAKDHPQWSIVLIGPNNIYTTQYRSQFDILMTFKNVNWLGAKYLNEIPSYLQVMDVCAIPNRINEFTRFVYPIKLHEYLAAGKPVISTGIPSVMPFEGVVHIANSPQEWSKSLCQAIAEQSGEWVERRQAVARQHTWEHRAEDVHRILSSSVRTKNVSV